MQNIFYKELLFLNYVAENKDDFFEKIAIELETNEFIKNSKNFISALYSRENEYSTAIGDSIAIPHCINQTVIKPFIAYIRLENFIDWESEISDCRKVKNIFLIGVNESSEQNHLQMLAMLARNLMHEDFKQSIFNSTNENEIYSKLEMAVEKC